MPRQLISTPSKFASIPSEREFGRGKIGDRVLTTKKEADRPQWTIRLDQVETEFLAVNADDVGRGRALLSGLNVELDTVTLVQGLESRADDGGVMHEAVALATVRGENP